MNKKSLKARGSIAKRVILLMIFTACFSGFAKSQQSGFGLGIMFGDPTGISGKGWISERSAIDGGIGWSFVNEGSIHVHMDYLYHFYNVFDTPRLPLYLGVGGRIKMKNTEHQNNDTRIGVRIPFGMAYQFAEVPVDVFLEVAPILDLSPDTHGTLNGAIGVRYYFK